jgi:hypothetical protein
MRCQAIKGNECIWLSERSQPKKSTYCMTQLYDLGERAKLWRQSKDHFYQGWREVGEEQRIFRAVKLIL